MSKRLSLPITTAVLTFATWAGASSEQFVVRVYYAAPTGCPTESEFLHQVLQRAHHTRLATDDEPAREFRAVITQATNTKTRARLDFVDSDSRRASRVIDGSSCNEVESALVLITALAVDPLLSDPELEGAATDAERHAGPEPKSSTLPPSTKTTVSQSSENDAAPPKVAQHVVPAFGASVGVVSDVAPDWVPNVSLFSELGSSTRSSALRLEVSYSQSESSRTDTASAVFRLVTGALQACPWSGNVVGGLRLWPCAAMETGVFRAEGRASQRLPFPNRTTTLWLAGDVVLRATIDLSRKLNLELGGKMRIPMLRKSYVYENPLIQAYETPALGAAVYVGVGVRFGG